MSSQFLTQRNERLNELSQIVMDGVITSKLDHIATVFINGRYYFTVFRRYNSPYNIVIEDYNSDIYLHQDYTVRKSLQTILCLRDYDARNIYTLNATSYKHNGPAPALEQKSVNSYDIADMRWTEIQSNYQAVNVNFGGLFQDPPAFEFYNTEVSPPSTPIGQIYSTPTNPPSAPPRPSYTTQPISDTESANILLNLSIPPQPPFFTMSESDGPTLSMRFSDIKKRLQQEQEQEQKQKQNNHINCYCQMNKDDEVDQMLNEDNYTVLRSGTQIPKSFI
jgi:hypothetical protein